MVGAFGPALVRRSLDHLPLEAVSERKNDEGSTQGHPAPRQYMRPSEIFPGKRRKNRHKRLVRSVSRFLIGSFQGNWLYRKNGVDDFMVFDDHGEFMYYVDSTRFGAKTELQNDLQDMTEQDWIRVTSFRFKPKSTEEDPPLPPEPTTHTPGPPPKRSSVDSLPVHSSAKTSLLSTQTPRNTTLSEVAGIIPKVALHWVKCPANMVDAAVWASLDPFTVALDYDEIDHIFARVVRTDEARNCVAAEVLPYRRRLAIGILYNSNKMDPDQILQMLQDGSFQNKPEDLIRSLAAMSPAPDDEKLLLDAVSHREYSEMDEMDLLSANLAAIPGLHGKLSCLLSTKTFLPCSRQIKTDLNILERAASQIVNSSKLSGVLHVLLCIGNFLNEGTARANCSGFSLSVLETVTTVKATSCEATLMDVLYEVVTASRPELIDLQSDLVDLSSAVTVSVDGCQEALSIVKDERASLEYQIQSLANDESFSVLARHLVEHRESMTETLEDLDQQKDKTANALEAMMVLFAEKKKKSVARQTELLGVVSNFVLEFERAGQAFASRQKMNALFLSPSEEDCAPPDQTSTRRCLHWTKAPLNLLSNSLWATGQPPLNLPTKVLNCLFSVDNTKAENLKRDLGTDIVTDVVEVLSLKRKHSANIILATSRMTVDRIIAVARNPQSEYATAIPPPTLSALASVCPSPDEESVLLQHDGQKLDSTDLFLFTLAKDCRGVREKLQCLSVLRTFPDDARAVLQEISICMKTITSVMGSKKLRRFFEIILAVGNYLNAGTARAGARGFNLDVLGTISNVKSPLRGVTLMQYLVQNVCRGQNIDLPIDDVSFPQRLPLEGIAERVSVITEIEKQVARYMETPEEDGFYDMVRESMEGVRTVCATTKRQLELLQAKSAELMIYFGERKKQSRPRQEAIVRQLQGFVAEVNEQFRQPLDETRQEYYRPLVEESPRSIVGGRDQLGE